MPATRSVVAKDNTGIHIEYHQVGTPMAGEVSPQLYSSSAMRADRMVSSKKKATTSEWLRIASRRRLAGVPPSAKSSMRTCWLRTKAAEQAVRDRENRRKKGIREEKGRVGREGGEKG